MGLKDGWRVYSICVLLNTDSFTGFFVFELINNKVAIFNYVLSTFKVIMKLGNSVICHAYFLIPLGVVL